MLFLVFYISCNSFPPPLLFFLPLIVFLLRIKGEESLFVCIILIFLFFNKHNKGLFFFFFFLFFFLLNPFPFPLSEFFSDFILLINLLDGISKASSKHPKIQKRFKEVGVFLQFINLMNAEKDPDRLPILCIKVLQVCFVFLSFFLPLLLTLSFLSFKIGFGSFISQKSQKQSSF